MKTYLFLAVITAALPTAFCATYTPPSADEQAMLDRTEAALAAAGSGAPAAADSGLASDVSAALSTLTSARSKAGITPQAAFRELLSLYDKEYDAVPGITGIRSQMVPRELARLNYRPAQAELRLRRDKAKARLSDPKDENAVFEYIGLSSALGEKQSALTLFDELPAGDPRRRSIGGYVYPTLVEKRRYKDAIEARPFSLMLASAEVTPQLFGSMPEHIRVRLVERRNENVARDIEALVGAGMIEEARTLQTLLLKRDSSNTMKATIKAGLKRAGNPGALDVK